MKQNNKPAESAGIEPSLSKHIIDPMHSGGSSGATSDEIAFFDRVKKFISNKSTMNEFLKLCNMFSQDLIDKNVLIHKVSSFIGGNQDLMAYFRNFINYEGDDEVIDNQPTAPSGRVALSNCRGLGPSYRLLPKRVRLFSCPPSPNSPSPHYSSRWLEFLIDHITTYFHKLIPSHLHNHIQIK